MADAITARNRRSIFSEGLIWIAVQPMLARLRRCDHRMSAGVRMFTGVLVRRAIAAKGCVAGLARPQVHPAGADLHAFRAFEDLGTLDLGNGVDVWAGSGIHKSG